MRTAIPVQEGPARNALTVASKYANHTRKPVAHAARSSARPVFSAIKRSIRSLSQQATDVIENEKPREEGSSARSFSFGGSPQIIANKLFSLT